MPSGLVLDRIGDEAVAKRTGKTWPEWFKALDKAGAKKLDHPAIARMLHDRFGRAVPDRLGADAAGQLDRLPLLHDGDVTAGGLPQHDVHAIGFAGLAIALLGCRAEGLDLPGVPGVLVTGGNHRDDTR